MDQLTKDIYDHLRFAGPTQVQDLASLLKVPTNEVQAILLDLMACHNVTYSEHSGGWIATREIS